MSLASTAPGLLCSTAGFERAAAHFTETGTVEAYLTFERALTEVQGALGLIPDAAVAPILDACRLGALDLDALRRDAGRVGYPIVPLVAQLADRAGPPGQWVHYGTTTQDVMDTALVLQVRGALDGVLADLARLEGALAGLGHDHITTPMAGRSKLQHAVPITFGYKVAVWLDQLTRRRHRLEGALAAASVVQFGGAAGTLSALGSDALDVRDGLAARLGLTVPDVSWHVARDRMADLAFAATSATWALATIAGDIAHMMSTEVAELREPAADGRGASSTMPQKRNPVMCEAIIEAAHDIQHAPARCLAAMDQRHERGIGHGYGERAAIAQAITGLAGAVWLMRDVVAGLEVDVARMRNNLDATGGIVLSEAVSMYLADEIGRVTAHQRVHAVCQRIAAEGVDLAEALRREGVVVPASVLSVNAAIAPARAMAARVLAASGEHGAPPDRTDTGRH